LTGATSSLGRRTEITASEDSKGNEEGLMRQLLFSLILASFLATSAANASAQDSNSSSLPRPKIAETEAPSAKVPGVALYQVAGGPAPLYVGEGVPAHQGDWAREAMQIAWQEAPRVSGLPLPRREIPVYLFRDEEQFDTATRQLVGQAIGHGGCSAIISGASERAIYCNASNLMSRDKMVDFVTHELTHQLIQGDLRVSREVATWYNEGLSEVVMHRVLETHGPAYAAQDQARRERLVTEAALKGNYIRLTLLTSGRQWRRATDSNVAYSEARLAVAWLVQRYGMEQAVAVVRRTDDTEGSFDQAFEAVFGMSVAEFDNRFAASLKSGGASPSGSGTSFNGGERWTTCLSGPSCTR
jgi:hypothetical protein